MQPLLDDSVLPVVERLSNEGFGPPDALLLLGTGSGTLPGNLGQVREVLLGELPDVPRAWMRANLFAGVLGGPGGARVWLLEDEADAVDTAEADGDTPPWERAWPCWLAAAAGATHMVHTSAGITLVGAGDGEPLGELDVGSLALVTDHINLSGSTPLRGLGETRLGPLFPDQSSLHDKGLRRRFLALARERGVAAAEAICACAPGPATSTPAELRWMASTGARVAVQGLAAPLLASAHAGLSVVAVVAITDRGDEPLRCQEIIERAERCAPGLEDLLLAASPDLAAAARAERGSEE